MTNFEALPYRAAKQAEQHLAYFAERINKLEAEDPKDTVEIAKEKEIYENRLQEYGDWSLECYEALRDKFAMSVVSSGFAFQLAAQEGWTDHECARWVWDQANAIMDIRVQP